MANEGIYLKNGNTVDIKDILKIRLHMWVVKKKTTQKITHVRYAQFAEKKKIQQSMCYIAK